MAQLGSFLLNGEDPDVERRYWEMVEAGNPSHAVQTGIAGLDVGCAAAARRYGCTWSHVNYWMQKFSDTNFHAQRRGGARNWKYGLMQQYFVESLLWRIVRDLPCENPQRYCRELQALGIEDVTPSWVTRAFKRWRYSRKKVYHIQRRKFTVLNVCRYLDHVMATPHLDPTKLKYLDESRFETRRVRRSHGYSARGRRIYSSAGDDYRQSYTVTLVRSFSLCLSIYLSIVVTVHTDTPTLFL